MTSKYIKERLAITTSVRIPIDIYNACEKQKIPYMQLIIRGFQVLNGEPQIMNRQNELEQEVEKLRRARDIMQHRIFELQEAIKNDN